MKTKRFNPHSIYQIRPESDWNSIGAGSGDVKSVVCCEDEE